MDNILISKVKINGLEYNPNRDPQVYRRIAGQRFRIEAKLGGTGSARCMLRDAGGEVVARQAVALPGAFMHELAFDAPGTRVMTLQVEAGGRSESRDLRLDVLAHAWVG